MARNRLADETSPYLLQHADNPVNWQPWDKAALNQAKAERKPILLSVGYAACHWCHVMAHESFEDEGIADLMNDRFVPIKVDREERPDLDQIYQTALALLGQQGGWPLTMFLTPDGEPFWGGTYFPPSPRFGRPGFAEVLRVLAETYAKEPDRVAKNVDALKSALGQLAENQAGQAVPEGVQDQLADRLVGEIDPIYGGIGGPPKFPHEPILEMIWRAYVRTGEERFAQPVTLTLTRMAQGGIYDHLGGGFARYSVDQAWLVPHFEKMLYDNAQLIDLLTLVWQGTRQPLFETRVRETVAWLLREMQVEGGAFGATLDADSEGEEGKYYVWTEAEIDRLLGDDAGLFKLTYDVSPAGNWEGRTILNRGRQSGLADPESEAKLARARDVLLAERAKRVRPGYDDKVLADWNGLTIAALAGAGLAFGETAWIDAARAAFGFVVERMVEDGRLHHVRRLGQTKHLANLDDHAGMVRAALALYEATGEDGYLDRAKGWVADCDRLFWDAEGGGYFFSPADAETLIVRTKTAYDSATPSGNGLLLGSLARLFYLTGEDAYRERAEQLEAAFAGELSRNAFSLATFLNSAELLRSALQVVIVGDPAKEDTRALLDEIVGRSLPNRLLMRVPPGKELPPGHPAAGKSAAVQQATAYVCRGTSCSLPITDPDTLGQSLAQSSAA
jgi:hypothetical protein